MTPNHSDEPTTGARSGAADTDVRSGADWWKGGEVTAQHLQRLTRGTDRTLSTDVAKLIAEASRSVAYLELEFAAGPGSGTGFLIAPDLLLTNAHNVEDKEFGAARGIIADFDREERVTGTKLVVKAILPPIARSVSRDWAVLRLERPISHRTPIALGTPYTVSVDDQIIIVQHPQGGFKRFALDALSLRFLNEDVIQYLADTQKGSSGSPVFNTQLHCVALHHSEAEWRVPDGDSTKTITLNEGIRILRVIEDLRDAGVTFSEDPETYIAQLYAQIQTRATGGQTAIPTTPAAPVMVGRAALLDALAAELLAPSPPIALVGLPGAAKTEVALALADRADVKAAFPDGRAWLDFGPDPILFDRLGRLLEQFGVPFEDIRSEAARADRLRQTLDGKACLVILSGVWREEDARPFLEAIRHPARAVFTTRSGAIARALNATKRDVPPLKPADAVEMLASAGDNARAAVEADRAAAKRLADALGYLPTPLRVAAHQLDSLAVALGARAALPRLEQDISDHLLSMQASGSLLSAPDERGATLGAILGASYDHLRGDAERRAFRQLAVFGAQPADFDDVALAAVWKTDAAATLDLIIELIESGLLGRIEQPDGEAPRYTLNQMVARFALDLLASDAGEREAARARHIACYLAAMRKARDADRYYTMRSDLPQVLNALRMADEDGDSESLMDLLDASFELLRQFGAGKARLIAAERGVVLAEAQDDPLKRARALATRALAHRDLAATTGEDHVARLNQALADNDAALDLYAGSPVLQATVLQNRTAVYRELAGLEGEDPSARLHQALDDLEVAAEKRRGDPSAYARTLGHHRVAVYRELAALDGADRGVLLHKALDDCDEALKLLDQDSQDYATVLNNRAVVYRELAAVPGEDRSDLLRKALADCEVALAQRRDDPSRYVVTLYNRATISSELASVDGEDRAERLRKALADLDAALLLQDTTPLEYARTLNQRASTVKALAAVDGEDRRGRLRQALTDAAQAVKAFETYRHAIYLVDGKTTLRAVRAEIVSAFGEQAFTDWWAELAGGQPIPDWLA
jgi:endonuclease G